MQLLKDVNINWIGRKWLMMGISLLMILISLSSLWLKGGPRYGIDFRGGTLVYIKFKDPPDLSSIRSALSEKGLGRSTIQRYGLAEENKLIISVDQPEVEVGGDSDVGRVLIMEALTSVYGLRKTRNGKVDLNTVTPGFLEEHLNGVVELSSLFQMEESLGLKSFQEVALAVTDYRDSHGGIIASYQELKLVKGITDGLLAALQEYSYLGDFAVFQTEFVGPKVGRGLQRQAISATCYALLGMLIYIAIRFKGTIYGAAAVLAVFHDVVITLGLFSLANREISLTVIAALLTLVGYSMNDTIVVFDRIRENLRLRRKDTIPEIVNRSINQTLGRTLLTSGSTFLTALSLYYLGGQVINGFAFALVIGVAVGTYSSIGVASPLLVIWYDYQTRKRIISRAARA